MVGSMFVPTYQLYLCSLVNQTQGAYQSEIISAHSEKVWCTAYVFLVLKSQQIFCQLLISVNDTKRCKQTMCDGGSQT